MINKTTIPELEKAVFICPHCFIATSQKWESVLEKYELIFLKQKFFFKNRLSFSAFRADQNWDIFNGFWTMFNDEKEKQMPYNFYYASCFNCRKHSIWVENKMVYPLSGSGPMPSKDMPENVKKIYDEARKVSIFSLRASAALLRVALEELTVHLGEKDGTLYERIVNLEKSGLSRKVIENLNIVRITANEGGAHAGQIDLENKDNEGIVDKLFLLINLIVEKTISDDKVIQKLRSKLPENKNYKK